ncbi:MAG: hypothetical protein R3E61_07880 [Pseudomonadales bacterium]
MKNFVGIAAVISPRKFCKVAVSISCFKNTVLESLLLPAKMLCQKLREFRAAFRLAVTQTLQTVAFGKARSAANLLTSRSKALALLAGLAAAPRPLSTLGGSMSELQLLRDQWQIVANALSIKFVAPFVLKLRDGTEWGFACLLPQFGNEQGILIGTEYSANAFSEALESELRSFIYVGRTSSFANQR